jgi:hypothetical protein
MLLIRVKTNNTALNGAPPLALLLLKMQGTPLLQRQALHVQLVRQRRQRVLVPSHHMPQARRQDQEGSVRREVRAP